MSESDEPADEVVYECTVCHSPVSINDCGVWWAFASTHEHDHEEDGSIAGKTCDTCMQEAINRMPETLRDTFMDRLLLSSLHLADNHPGMRQALDESELLAPDHIPPNWEASQD